MQTIKIDGTTYTVIQNGDPIELSKLVLKSYKNKRASIKDGRQYDNLDFSKTALYDPSIPLLEILPDAEATS